jgi:hypothetical protein
LKIIGSSGLHEMIDQVAYTGLRLSGTLVKPYEPGTLLKIVQECLG